MLETMLTVNGIVALGVLFLEIALLGKIFSLVLVSLPKSEFRNNFLETVYTSKEKIFHSFGIDVLSDKLMYGFIFIFSFVASFMTLVYSEYFLQEPCSLCWWQRVFMYGIVLLSLQAYISNDGKKIKNYILTFSFFGLFFSLYQHAQQMLALYGTKLPCPVSAVDCSKMTIFEYGHITFPWMAAVLFAFFIVIIVLQNKLQQR